MSVLIKELEKPKRCLDCPCLAYKMRSYAECRVTHQRLPYSAVTVEIPTWCPMVEVKDGDGT